MQFLSGSPRIRIIGELPAELYVITREAAGEKEV